MKKFQVYWAKKQSSGYSKGELQSIGGIDGEGNVWNMSVDNAITGIQKGEYEFFLLENWLEIPITIQTLNQSEIYLSSKGHGYLYNLLDELPEFTFA